MSFNKSTLHFVHWPVRNVQAFTTTRYVPEKLLCSFSSTTNQTYRSEETTQSLEYRLIKRYSKSPYNDFNLGLHVGDEEKVVSLHRQHLHKLLPSSTKIQWFDQVHGSHVECVDEHNAYPIIADAAITKNTSVALAVMTADCLPILITNSSGSEIAAIHAGWRPLVAGILLKTINSMQSSASDLHVWLGPCIGSLAFEVGLDVKSQFVEKSIEYGAFFTNRRNGKYLADLAGLAKMSLIQQGIKSIYHLPHCTYSQPEYFSYRRDKKTGRMASVICITGET